MILVSSDINIFNRCVVKLISKVEILMLHITLCCTFYKCNNNVLIADL